MRDLYQPQNEELTYSELLEVCKQVMISVDNEDVTKIEMFTRDQNKSSAWYTQRAGRITASIMKSVCVSDPGNPAQSIIKRVCYPDSTKFKTAATAWGCEHESSARVAYINLMEFSHTASSCKESGLVVSLTHPFIGASLDGVVHCECCGHGVNVPTALGMKILVQHLVCWMENYLINMHTFTRCKPSYSQIQLATQIL